MRNVFLALVLANLAFMAWQHWFAERPQGRSPFDSDVPGITLVSELDGRAEPERSAQGARSEPVAGATSVSGAAPQGGEPPAAATAAPAERCVSVGPFRELADVAAATSKLRAAGHAPRQRVAEGEIWVGYWVHLGSIATVAEANRILTELQGHGIGDSYVIPGADESLVSLGVFSEISRAGRRREELRALGYEPIISDSTRRATVYWVDVTVAPGEGLDFDSLQTAGRIMRLEQRTCGAP